MRRSRDMQENIRAEKQYWIQRAKTLKALEEPVICPDDETAVKRLGELWRELNTRRRFWRRYLRHQFNLDIRSPFLGQRSIRFIGGAPKQVPDLPFVNALTPFARCDHMIHLFSMTVEQRGNGKTWEECYNEVRRKLVGFAQTDIRQDFNIRKIRAAFSSRREAARSLEDAASETLSGYVSSRINRTRDPDLPKDFDTDLPGAVLQALAPLLQDRNNILLISGEAEAVQKLLTLQNSVTALLKPTNKRNDAMNRAESDPDQMERAENPAGQDFARAFIERETRRAIFNQLMSTPLPDYLQKLMACLQSDPEQTNAELAKNLGWEEGSVKSAKNRLRKKFPDAADLLR
ncbi:MAG TPA: hypothetical protein VKU00_19935 [Chthonomonadaceae bacterium]|nr:hypothetical protein [Chthonomonadaceae bacterium]